MQITVCLCRWVFSESGPGLFDCLRDPVERSVRRGHGNARSLNTYDACPIWNSHINWDAKQKENDGKVCRISICEVR